MKNYLLKFATFALLAAALAFAPAKLNAQSTNKSASASEKKGEKKKAAHPIHGKIAAVDKAAKTITVGKTTYQITSQTKMMKADKPATLEDGVVGEDVRGYAKPGEDGKMDATSLSFGPKAEGEKKSKK